MYALQRPEVKTIGHFDIGVVRDEPLGKKGPTFRGPRGPWNGEKMAEFLRLVRNAERADLAAGPFDGSITQFSDLKVFSNNQMLVRAISDNNQSKEIIGIVKDIRLISSKFASISIAHISRSLSSDADRIAKDTFQVSVSL